MNAVLDSSELDFPARITGKRRLLAGAFSTLPFGNALGGVTVGEVMTPRPSCVAPETTAMELVHLFQERRFRHLLVVDRERLVGVVSDRDVIRLLSSSDEACGRTAMEQLTAGELMSNGAVTVTPACSLVKAVRILVERNIHCLPVTDGERPIGILTGTDLFLSLELLLTVLATADDYIE